MSQTQIRPVDFNPTSSPDITHTEANNNNNDHNNNVNNSNANNDIDKSIMKESSPKSTNLRKNPQIIHRTILLGKKVFEYKGPVNQEIMDLLDLIESNASTDYQGIFEWVKNPLNKLKEINEQVEQKFTCINGLVRVNLNDFLLQFVFWLMYAVACIRLKVNLVSFLYIT